MGVQDICKVPDRWVNGDQGSRGPSILYVCSMVKRVRELAAQKSKGSKVDFEEFEGMSYSSSMPT